MDWSAMEKELEEFRPYDVFINHRGPDAKKTLASLLHYDLTTHELRVFLDAKELQVGDSSISAINFAIRSASVQIAIFSPEYASSDWCLNELLMMHECLSSTIVPIFYDIKPSDLENVAEGAYARAFQIHREKGVTVEQVNRWIAALEKVSGTSGLMFNTAEDNHGERLKQIVEIVLEKVGRVPLGVCDNPVGLDQAAQNFEEEVLNRNESNGTRVVWIVGPAGSGKSTLAAHLYDSKRRQFERVCFLPVANETSLPFLQQTLLKGLLFDQNVRIQNTQTGKSILRRRLRGLPRVLIVFDGMKNKDQIDNLLFVKDILGNESLILVTCGDQTLLLGSQDDIYNVKPLEAKDAQELFCWYAFRHPKPPQNLKDTVDELVGACDRFPLDLKRSAEELCGEADPSKWKRHLKSLHKQRSKKWWRGGFWKDRMTNMEGQ